MKDKSIIIIGAGLAGLSTGCYAQINGYKSQIYEMHNIPGGLCTSWKRKGYVFDGCIHYLMNSRSGTYHRFYKELGAVHGREMIDNDEFARVESASGKTWTVYSNIDRLEKHMKDLSSQDARIIEELCKKARLFSNYNFPVEKPMELMNFIDMLKMLRNLPAMMAMVKYSDISIQSYATRFKDPFLRNVFPQILEDIPDMPMISVLMSLACLHNNNYGWPTGGSLEFSRSIEKRYKDLDGKINYKTRVKKIIVKDNQAVGIRTEDGTELYADIIVSAADGHTTIYDMLNGKYLDDKIKQRYNECSIYEPFIQISLGIAFDLSNEPHFTVLELDKPIKVGNQMRKWVTVKHYCYDSSMAPSGKSVMTASFIFNDYDYWDELYKNPKCYKKEKQSLADAVIRQLEIHYPDIKGKIEVVDVATPITYKRYTDNWKGSYMGWKGMDMSKPMKRTLPGLSSFFMAGQWVFPGGGVPGAITSGRHLIQCLCKEDKKTFATSVK